MTRFEQLSAEVKLNKMSARDELKKQVQEELDKQEIDYADAITIFNESGLFEINRSIPNHAPWIVEYFNDNGAPGWFHSYETVSFVTIVEWINGDEGELREAYDAIGSNKSYDPIKDIYEYIIKSNKIGYILDW